LGNSWNPCIFRKRTAVLYNAHTRGCRKDKISGVTRVLTSFLFSAELSFFTRDSNFIAADLLSNSQHATSDTGRFARVYRAPLPSLCFFTRASTSSVQPV